MYIDNRGIEKQFLKERKRGKHMLDRINNLTLAKINLALITINFMVSLVVLFK